MNRSWQEHIGLWEITLQLAFLAHWLTHGSIHFWLIQALSVAHSLLMVHSGRQFGGVPFMSGWQLQTACKFISRHKLFGPHGEGVQGDGFSTSVITNSYYSTLATHSADDKQEMFTNLTLSCFNTIRICVARKPWRTVAWWQMIHNLAKSIRSTYTRTRIFAFGLYTS